MSEPRMVGPVLLVSPLGEAVAGAIEAGNSGAQLIDRGGYVRILVPNRCELNRAEVERLWGSPFRLPGDLERVMPSFQGKLTITDDRAVWEEG